MQQPVFVMQQMQPKEMKQMQPKEIKQMQPKEMKQMQPKEMKQMHPKEMKQMQPKEMKQMQQPIFVMQQMQPKEMQRQPNQQQQPGCQMLQLQPKETQQMQRPVFVMQQMQPQSNQQRIQQLFGDEMTLADFDAMTKMQRKFYIPPEFRPKASETQQRQCKQQQQQQQHQQQQQKGNSQLSTKQSTQKQTGPCLERSLCKPSGMGSLDPNCQGPDCRVKSGYQPSFRGDAVDRTFNACDKFQKFRDGTSKGHKAAHYQFGKEGILKNESLGKKCKSSCPEEDTIVGNRSVFPKLGGMVPGYGGHVPGYERCKFGKTYGRETAEVLKKVKSNEKFPQIYTMAEWREKCYNPNISC